jgi:tetratricopeptide (TPR) repeat protein
MPLLNTGVKAEAYYLVGCCYAGEKDHESAIRYFEKALEHDPENDDYAHGLQVLRDIVSRK